MTRKTRLTIIAAIVLIFILLLVWLWLFLRTPQTEESETLATIEPQADEVIDSGPNIQQQQLEQQQQTRSQAAGATTVAKTFAERYGSYSNEARFQNMTDLFPLMTDAFADSTREFIRTAEVPETYYGVTTRVLTVDVKLLDEQVGASTILMRTQREIAEVSTQNSRVEYQEIEIMLVKQAGVWKVDSATWL